jgi:hypothetical protein
MAHHPVLGVFALYLVVSSAQSFIIYCFLGKTGLTALRDAIFKGFVSWLFVAVLVAGVIGSLYLIGILP